MTGTPGEALLRVAIIDDDTTQREGLPNLLTGITVVFTGRAVEDLLLYAQTHPVDVVLLDLNLNGVGDDPSPMHGRRGVEALAAAGLRVLIYTSDRRRHVLAGCYQAGARGVVHKTESIKQLREAINHVAAGGVVLTTAITGLAELVADRGAFPTLTERQLEILRSRARGEPYARIAERLNIAPKTAEEHMAIVGQKFAEFLRSASPADLERELGVGAGDLMS